MVKGNADRAAGDSLEQRQAERLMIALLAQDLGCELTKRSFRLPASGWLEIDGVSERAVQKIKNAAASSRLGSHRRMVYLLYRWRDFSGSDVEAREWVTKLVQTDEGLLSFLVSCVTRPSSQGMEDFVAVVEDRIELKDVEAFMPVQEAQQRVARLDAARLGKMERRAVEAFKETLRRRDDPRREG